MKKLIFVLSLTAFLFVGLSQTQAQKKVCINWSDQQGNSNQSGQTCIKEFEARSEKMKEKFSETTNCLWFWRWFTYFGVGRCRNDALPKNENS